jgi:hypothetical protein
MRIRDTRYLSHRTSFENRESPLFFFFLGLTRKQRRGNRKREEEEEGESPA